MQMTSQDWDNKVTAPDKGARLTLLVMDRRSLMREALISLLGTIAAFRIVPVADVTEVAALPEDVTADIDMAILNLGSDDLRDETIRDEIEAIHRALPSAPLIAICDRDDPTQVNAALRLNLRGYIPASLTSQILRGVLRLVEAGGTFVPVGALSAVPPARDLPSPLGTASLADVYPMGLTRRQMQVLELLRKGKPNKLIAYELSMQESTVKVHVRQIMRKLQVTNRTEAAFFSLNASPEI